MLNYKNINTLTQIALYNDKIKYISEWRKFRIRRGFTFACFLVDFLSIHLDFNKHIYTEFYYFEANLYFFYIIQKDFSYSGLGDKTHSTEFSCGKSDSKFNSKPQL
jgi:hypothetical protein